MTEIEEFIYYSYDFLLNLLLRKKADPTKVLIKIITQLYGHEVDYKKFVKLIETSPISKSEDDEDKKNIVLQHD